MAAAATTKRADADLVLTDRGWSLAKRLRVLSDVAAQAYDRRAITTQHYYTFTALPLCQAAAKQARYEFSVDVLAHLCGKTLERLFRDDGFAAYWMPNEDVVTVSWANK